LSTNRSSGAVTSVKFPLADQRPTERSPRESLGWTQIAVGSTPSPVRVLSLKSVTDVRTPPGLRRGPCDESFDCQLPAEVRTELLEIPSAQVYRLREIPPPYQFVAPLPPEFTGRRHRFRWRGRSYAWSRQAGAECVPKRYRNMVAAGVPNAHRPAGPGGVNSEHAFQLAGG